MMPVIYRTYFHGVFVLKRVAIHPSRYTFSAILKYFTKCGEFSYCPKRSDMDRRTPLILVQLQKVFPSKKKMTLQNLMNEAAPPVKAKGTRKNRRP